MKFRIHKWHIGLLLALTGLVYDALLRKWDVASTFILAGLFLLAYDAWWHSTYGTG